MSINFYYINGKWITLSGIIATLAPNWSDYPLWSGPEKNWNPRENDHQLVCSVQTDGKQTGCDSAAEWKWKENPRGAGSVQIESTCRSSNSKVLFYSGFIDTSLK